MHPENIIAALFILQDVVWSFLLDGTRDLSRCPSSVSRDGNLFVHEERCYQFVIFQEKYWTDARNDCSGKGGSLVIIKDQQTQQFIMATLGYLGNSKHGIWIGLSDSRKELHWEWVNGEPLSGYSNWAGNEGGANGLHLTQDCAQIRWEDHGLWHDENCHLWPQTFSYICQFDMTPTRTTTTSTRTTTTTTSTTTKPTTTLTSIQMPTSTSTFTSTPTTTPTTTPIPTSTSTLTPIPTSTSSATPMPTTTPTISSIPTTMSTTAIPTTTSSTTAIPTTTSSATPIPTTTSSTTPIPTTTSSTTPIPTTMLLTKPLPITTSSTTPIPITTSSTVTTLIPTTPSSTTSIPKTTSQNTPIPTTMSTTTSITTTTMLQVFQDGDCNFDNKQICEWTNVASGDDFDWTIHQSATPTAGTGPENDHTTGTAQGSFVYIETSAPRKLGDKAWLLGPEITAYQTICLSFWYNMNGESAATLSVYVSSNGTLPGSQLWTQAGHQGLEWREARVPLMTSSLSRYKVLFEATVGDGYLGDIAIDDVTFSKEDCQGHPGSMPSQQVLVGR